MKTKLFASLFVCCLIATVSLANLTTMQVTTKGRIGGLTNGGELTVETKNIPGYADGSSFKTFCLERNESIRPKNVTYDVVINTAAVRGGVGGGNPDPLDPMTAYLYSRYANGDLANWTTSFGKAQDDARHRFAGSYVKIVIAKAFNRDL